MKDTNRVMLCLFRLMNDDRNGLLSIVHGLDYVGRMQTTLAVSVTFFGRRTRQMRVDTSRTTNDDVGGVASLCSERIRLRGGVGFNKLPLGNRNRNHSARNKCANDFAVARNVSVCLCVCAYVFVCMTDELQLSKPTCTQFAARKRPWSDVADERIRLIAEQIHGIRMYICNNLFL